MISGDTAPVKREELPPRPIRQKKPRFSDKRTTLGDLLDMRLAKFDKMRALDHDSQ